MSPRPLGYATLAVLKALADGRRYGFDVVDHTGLASGTVYPALSTLERRGLVTSAWESEEVAHSQGRPRRRYYRMTPKGTAELRSAMEHFGALGLRPSAISPEVSG